MARADYQGDPWAEKVKCLVCIVDFPDRDAYRIHTKSAWHKENTSRKMMGESMLTEEQWKKEFGPKEEPKKENESSGVSQQGDDQTKQQIDNTIQQESPTSDKAASGLGVNDNTDQGTEEPIDNSPPPSANEVDVCIVFDYKGERWSHKFRVQKGCSVLELKRLMIKTESPEEDVVSFDLQKRRIRVNNYETIDNPETYEFAYIGPEEGQRKKEKDKDLKAQRDEQARHFMMHYEKKGEDEANNDAVANEAMAKEEAKKAEELRRQEERAAEEKKRKEQKEKEQKEQQNQSDETPEVDPPDDVSGPGVVIYLHHLEADPLKGKTMSVIVPCTVSVRFLRRAVCNKIGRRKIADVRIHKKGQTYSQWPLMQDDELLGSRREFFARGADLIPAAVPLAPETAKGVAAAAPAAATTNATAEAKGHPPLKKVPGGLVFKVTHDTEDDAVDVSVAKGKAVIDLKRAICDRVKRGPYTKVVLADSKGNPLAETLALDKLAPEERDRLRLAGIDICPPFKIDLRVVHASNPAQTLTVSVEDTASVSDVRQVILAARKGFKPVDIKFVMQTQKAVATPSPMPDTMRLNGKRELYALGKIMDSLPSS